MVVLIEIIDNIKRPGQLIGRTPTGKIIFPHWDLPAEPVRRLGEVWEAEIRDHGNYGFMIRLVRLVESAEQYARQLQLVLKRLSANYPKALIVFGEAENVRLENTPGRILAMGYKLEQGYLDANQVTLFMDDGQEITASPFAYLVSDLNGVAYKSLWSWANSRESWERTVWKPYCLLMNITQRYPDFAAQYERKLKALCADPDGRDTLSKLLEVLPRGTAAARELLRTEVREGIARTRRA